MSKKQTTKFWIESCLAAASGVLCIVTLITPDWIEVVFHVDPDGGSGALEWVIVAAFLAVFLVSAGLARRERLRASMGLVSPE
jgi:hypothetical protein